jgi:hypothetical protein
LAWRVNSEARPAAQALRTEGRRRSALGFRLMKTRGARVDVAQTCSTATTPGAAFSAPAIAALTE